MATTETVRQMIVEVRTDIADLRSRFDLPDDAQQTCGNVLAQLNEIELQLDTPIEDRQLRAGSRQMEAS